MDRPILFSAPMVRAILAGQKTQTRRVVKGLPAVSLAGDVAPVTDGKRWAISRSRLDHRGGAAWPADPKPGLLCPYGQPGDRLWVRETWAHVFGHEECESWEQPTKYFVVDGWHKNIAATNGGPVFYDADGYDEPSWPWRPSIHMPRWASRLTLEVTGVRVERLCEISEEDARAEGVERNDLIISGFDEGIRYRDYAGNDDMAEWFSDPVRSCRTLWESIHGPGSWDANPWVWVVEFKRVNVEADHA